MLNKHKVNTDKLEIRITAMVGVALLTALTMASGRAVADNGQSEDEVVTPVGSLVAFAGAAVPNGWLLCDGRAVSRTTYSALFAAIGTAWGVGDGSTTFNLPDMRGRFLRGVDNGAGRDPDSTLRFATNGGNAGDRVGSGQPDQFRSHTHVYGMVVGGPAFGGSGRGLITQGFPTSLAGGSETRPINMNVNWIIRWRNEDRDEQLDALKARLEVLERMVGEVAGK